MVRRHFHFICIDANVDFFEHSSVSRPSLRHCRQLGLRDIANARDILILLRYIIQITFLHICDEFVYPWTQEKKNMTARFSAGAF